MSEVRHDSASKQKTKAAPDRATWEAKMLAKAVENKKKLEVEVSAVEPDWLPNAERAGLVRNRPGQPFEHYCMSCGAWGAFGFDVNILAGKTGRWYCNEHKPQE